MEYVIFGWLGAFILFIAVEIATVSLTTIWFAAGSFIALVLNLCKTPLAVQVAAFFVVSLLALIFARPYFEKLIKRGEVKTNVDSLVGMQASEMLFIQIQCRKSHLFHLMDEYLVVVLDLVCRISRI